MGNWIAFLIFVVLGVADTIFAIQLHSTTPWRFLLAGNPQAPSGEYVYQKRKFQKVGFCLCCIYASVFYMTALAALLTTLLQILPNGWMAAALYVHGAVIILAAFGTLAYLDVRCQNRECQLAVEE